MPLKRLYYDVYVAPLDQDGTPDFDAEPLEFEVEVRHADMLRAELEGNKNGIPNASVAPMHAASLWAWASLQRTKALECRYIDFKRRALAVQARKGDAAVDVDPTRLDLPDDLPSSSPPTSETSAAGSTPTPTTS